MASYDESPALQEEAFLTLGSVAGSKPQAFHIAGYILCLLRSRCRVP